MVCKNCGATLIDEAVFCNNCGTRVDGKKPCKKCGRLNDENNTFCIFCGERIDGKQTCSFCGATVEGKFCPHCGNKVGTTPTKQSALKNQPQQKEKPSFFNKLFGHIGQGSLILGVLLALIFVCFIGIRVSYVEEGTIVARGKESLFYFFGKYYKAVRAIKNSLNTTTRLEIINITQLVVYGVTGTIIGAATLLCTFGFGIVAIVRYILWVTGKSEKKVNTGRTLAYCPSFVARRHSFYIRE